MEAFYKQLNIALVQIVIEIPNQYGESSFILFI